MPQFLCFLFGRKGLVPINGGSERTSLQLGNVSKDLPFSITAKINALGMGFDGGLGFCGQATAILGAAEVRLAILARLAGSMWTSFLKLRKMHFLWAPYVTASY